MEKPLPPTEFADGEVPAVSRIVSLAPSNTEIAYYLGLGPQVVGVCDDSDWPPDARTKAKVGMDLQIDAAKVAALHPDLVLASLSVPGMEKCVAAVRERGLDAIALDPKSVENVMENIEEVARAAGVPGRGRALAAWMRGEFRRVEGAVEGLRRPTVFWEWWPRPLISPGAKSWMVDIIRIAGGVMLFAEQDKESFHLEAARVIDADPDVVVLCWVGAIAHKQEPAKVYERDGWQNVRAVKERRVYALSDVLFAAPGPRLVEGARLLAKVLHPEAALEGGRPPMSRIATGTGDKGETGLFDGSRAKKTNPIIRAFGDVDELDAAIGLAVTAADRTAMRRTLQQLQHELFILKADLATPRSSSKKIQRITKADVQSLDKRIDEVEASLPELRHFIAYGGTACAAQLQVARAIARRAERSAWEAHTAPGAGVGDELLVWLNRLSDYLFLLARRANKDSGVAEDEMRLADEKGG